jgi:hypothetical protein
MRPSLNLRQSRPLVVGAGALMLTIPPAAASLNGGRAAAEGAAATPVPQSEPQIVLRPRQLRYGHKFAVTGTASVADAGQMLLLEFAPAGSTRWRTLTAGRVHRSGRFRLVASLRQSGFVRVVGISGAFVQQVANPQQVGNPQGTTIPAPAIAIAPSDSQHVAVAAELRVPTGSLNVLGGQAVDIRGRLLPAGAGRRVRLEARSGGGWQKLATSRTGPRGGFHFHYVPGGLGQQQLRVRFAGDRRNARVSTGAGQLTVYRPSVASWYDDGGSTACGFHAYFGVANTGLPCGTQVTFHYGGQSVTAVVDDRGPFVGGREWDLNQNTASALGFGGVDTVWSSA